MRVSVKRLGTASAALGIAITVPFLPIAGAGASGATSDPGSGVPTLSAEAVEHLDPATKNALARGSEGAANLDTGLTPAQESANQAYVASQRHLANPVLTTVPLRAPRTAVPVDRYAMAESCYTLSGVPMYFQAADLGKYLIYTKNGRYVGPAGEVATPSADTVWTAQGTNGSFTFSNARGYLHAAGAGFAAQAAPAALQVRLTPTCKIYPEVSLNVSGNPHAGITSYQEVRGYVDAHVHGMAHEFLGGDVICSPPWDPYGAPYALVDCPDHQLANGKGAILEDVLAGHTPGTGHDPVGWPTFAYWPNPHSLTHQNVYYRGIERSWRGGQRIFVNLLVENNVLCELYPIKHNSCDDESSIRRQAADMYKMQDYIDAQYGGPGKGFYRIVTDPFQARRVINQGKLAVVMGIETSNTLGCSVNALQQPTCSQAQMLAELHAVRAMGVSQMELTNKFDNAFTGVAGDSGTIGPLTNFANFFQTGSWLRMQTCPSTYGPNVHDNEQTPNAGSAPGGLANQGPDAILAGIATLYGLNITPAPLYPSGPHCNTMGLSPLGKTLLSHMADEHVMFDPDHMSVNARKSALQYVAGLHAAGKPLGVLSSHSWSTPDSYPLIYKLGGFVAPYAGDSTGFLAKWKQHLKWADPHYYFGFGWGADMNGFGAQGDPRGTGVSNPVTYPFTGLNGVQVGKNRAGQKLYDINRDGVAQYGLYPDWVRDVTILAGTNGQSFDSDMARGAEAYLQTWERAWGLKPDSCRNPNLRVTESTFRARAVKGSSTRTVMERLGQPYTRLGSTFGYCALSSTGSAIKLNVTFNAAGTVVGVVRG